jgi:hypothetical protein
LDEIDYLFLMTAEKPVLGEEPEPSEGYLTNIEDS